MIRLATATAALLATVSGASAAITSSEAKRLEAAATITREIKDDIPEDVWNRAHCVVVIPELKKAAFIVGGEYGKGVMSCRAGDQWSAPVFMQLAKGSWGFQAGVEQVDLVLLVMNERGVQKLLQNKTTLGADASVAAGPVGRRAVAATDAAMTAEILSYSHSRGLFAGLDISGGVLRPDEEANVDVYGRGAQPRTILASREISAPPEARDFLRALGSVAPATAPRSTGAATPPAPRTTTMPTTDDDLRARVVDIQQSLDRILADTTPAAVGTSGTTSTTRTDASPTSTTVTVDRARLMQLRQQLDALIAALNKR